MKGYIKDKRTEILMLILILAVFAVTGILYKVHPMVILYPTVIVTALCLIYFLIGYYKRRGRLRDFKRLMECISQPEIALPAASDELEEDYQQLIGVLRDERIKTASEAENRYRQMMDYYTLWAHQIKTPIASMRLTLGTMDSVEARKLNSELTRIEQYVAMVLTYLRLDFDTSDYLFAEHEVDDIIRPVVRKFASEFIDRKLSLDYEPVNKKIVTDEKWFSFCLEQILSNALKYTGKGSIRIYVDNDWLVVEDSGIGIAPEDLPRIFEKGYTGFNGRVHEQATGIGLYLCKRICDGLGLDIKAESRLGEGTKIKVFLNSKKINVND